MSLITLPHETLVRARRRIQIALCILEDGGCHDLLTTEDVSDILSSAVADLDEVLPPVGTTEKPQDWDAYPAHIGGGER